MDNNIIEITDETRNKLRDFDEQEAYFLLCEIFSQAQSTKDYAKFQSDLSEWKKRFPVDLFSEEYRRKIKYMLSKEFLDKVLKGFIAFDELSKKDPSKGLEKLRKILKKAEKHKDSKQLDKDLEVLYSEYPLKFLKEKYPHVVSQLLSKSNRTRILEKFDSSLAFKELTNIIEHSQDYNNVNDFKSTIEEWQKIYPTNDFNDKFKGQVEQLLSEYQDDRKLEEIFPTALDLSEGEVIPIEIQHNISKLNKDALHDFFKIVDKNRGDINSLFDWTCKYAKYINSFDVTTKNAIVNNLMMKFAYELPPINTKYQIPKMDSGIDDLLSLSDFQSLDDTKKEVVLQLLGILSNNMELSNEDIYRLQTIDSNVQKARQIEKARIEPKVEFFMENLPEDNLTPTDNIYLGIASDTRAQVEINDHVDLTLHDDTNDNMVVEELHVHTSDPNSFKDTIRITETLERINSGSASSGTADAGATSGGSAVSITSSEVQETEKNTEEILDDDGNDKDASEEKISVPQSYMYSNIKDPEHNIHAIILENEPKMTSKEDVESDVSDEETLHKATILDPISTPHNSRKPTFRERIADIIQKKPRTSGDREDR